MRAYLTAYAISPKVLGPFLLTLVGGAILWLIGDTQIAKGVLSAAALHLVAGYALPPGQPAAQPSSYYGDLDPLTDVPTEQIGTNPPTGAPAPVRPLTPETVHSGGTH